MKEKFYAYLGFDRYWSIKKFNGEQFLLDRVKEALDPTSLVKGFIMPFELEIPEHLTMKKLCSSKYDAEKLKSFLDRDPALDYINSLLPEIN